MSKQKILSACIALSLFSCELEEIPDEITFEKTFGGAANDAGQSVQQTQDGGYIITGSTSSAGAGGSDVYLIKTDVYGNKEFEKYFGGTENEVGFSIQQTNDAGYIITGYTYDSTGAGERDVYLIKTVSNGNSIPLNSSTFGGPADDEGRSVQQTQDGGYIITGSTASTGVGGRNVYLIKTDEDGNIVFEKYFGGTASDVGLSVQQTQDGGYIITGYTHISEARLRDVYLIKTDVNGNKEFEKYFGGSGNDVGLSVQQTQDGGFIITGYTYSIGAGDSDVYLIKTDAKGDTVKTNDNIVFVKSFGGTATDLGYAVQQTQDEGYIISGYTYSSGAGRSDAYLIKTDVYGDIEFENTFGGAANDDGRSVQQTQDGGYIITGFTESTGEGGGDVYLIKTNANGNVER